MHWNWPSVSPACLGFLTRFTPGTTFQKHVIDHHHWQHNFDPFTCFLALMLLYNFLPHTRLDYHSFWSFCRNMTCKISCCFFFPNISNLIFLILASLKIMLETQTNKQRRSVQLLKQGEAHISFIRPTKAVQLQKSAIKWWLPQKSLNLHLCLH